MQKKGQAAMEFLMTYGWAILAAVVAIGVLAYFGVFSPQRYMPEVCTIASPLGCDEHQISSNSVRVIMRNGAGNSVNITSFKVGNCSAVTTVGVVADGDTADVNSTTDCGTGTSGDKFKADITIRYLKSGATIEQTATGTVSGRVS